MLVKRQFAFYVLCFCYCFFVSCVVCLQSKQWSCIVSCLCCLLSFCVNKTKWFSCLHLMVLFLFLVVLCPSLAFLCFFIPFKKRLAISHGHLQRCRMPDIENSRKTAEKGAEWVTVKQPKNSRNTRKTYVLTEFRLFFGCFGCFSGCFSAVLPWPTRHPFRLFFGCFQCRAFGTSVGGRGDCKKRPKNRTRQKPLKNFAERKDKNEFSWRSCVHK